LQNTLQFWKSYRKVSFIKPYWGITEFWNGILYRDVSNNDVLRMLTDKFKRKFNVSGAIIPTSSGRTALELALRVLKKNYPAKRKVMIPTYCCRGVFDPVTRAGLTPVFADIDENLNLSKDSVEHRASRDILAVVVPHIGGCGAGIEQIALLAKQYDMVVIEDACQSLGRKSSGFFAGSRYDMSMFSFGLGKNVMATAGGLLLSNILETDTLKEARNLGEEDASVVKRRFWNFVLRYFLNLGRNIDDCLVSAYKYNWMHPLDAKLALSQLDRLDEIVHRRRRNAKAIIDTIHKVALNARLQQDKDHIYTKLPLIFNDSEECHELRRTLQGAGVETESMYVPLHLREFAAAYSTGESLPNSEEMYGNVFNVPVRPNLSQRELGRIIRAIESVGRG